MKTISTPSKAAAATATRTSFGKKAAAAGTTLDRNQKHLQDLSEKRFEDNILKEVEFKRFHEAKRRLRNFLIHTNMSDVEERHRLLSYFSHRYVTLIAVIKEATRSKRLMKGQKAGEALPATLANVDGVNTEITKKFTLKNKELIAAMDDHNEEEAAVESAKQLAAYKKSRGLAPETKIFKELGKYPVLCEELNRRGMVEHDWEEIEESKENFTSQAFDFIYFLRARDVFRISLAPH